MPSSKIFVASLSLRFQAEYNNIGGIRVKVYLQKVRLARPKTIPPYFQSSFPSRARKTAKAAVAKAKACKVFT